MTEFFIKIGNLVASAGYFFLALVVLSLAIGVWRFFWKRGRVRTKVAGMESGIYVRHGMTVDQETGFVSSSKGPSETAYHKL